MQLLTPRQLPGCQICQAVSWESPLRQRFAPFEQVWGFQADSGDGLCHTSGECLADRLSLTLDGLATPAVDHLSIWDSERGGGCIVTAEEWALAASSFFAGLAAGFLGGLCTIIRPMQAAMTGPEFRTFMERFLRYADNGLGKAFNYAWSGGTTIASIVALVLLFDDPGSTSFVLTAIGLGVWIVGVLVVSNVWKTPTYKMILAGDPEAMPADWEATRQRYFTINWLQLATTWAAFALFLVALISL
jgi:hypothetical protein